MKGLLLKDLICLKGTGKIYAVMAILFAALGLLGMGSEMRWMPMGLILMLGGLLPFTSAILDEQARWDRFALTLPLGRRMLAFSKYLLGGVILLTGVAVDFLLGLTMSIPAGELLVGIWALVVVSLFLLVLIVPLILRFGAEKGRLLLMCVSALIAGFFVAISGHFGVAELHENSLLRLLAFATLGVAALLPLSMWLSVRVYEKREF